jgi:hypothetical protein
MLSNTNMSSRLLACCCCYMAFTHGSGMCVLGGHSARSSESLLTKCINGPNCMHAIIKSVLHQQTLPLCGLLWNPRPPPFSQTAHRTYKIMHQDKCKTTDTAWPPPLATHHAFLPRPTDQILNGSRPTDELAGWTLAARVCSTERTLHKFCKHTTSLRHIAC